MLVACSRGTRVLRGIRKGLQRFSDGMSVMQLYAFVLLRYTEVVHVFSVLSVSLLIVNDFLNFFS
jgi:hypothetical protein